jgi:hypothetical protein
MSVQWVLKDAVFHASNLSSAKYYASYRILSGREEAEYTIPFMNGLLDGA